MGGQGGDGGGGGGGGVGERGGGLYPPEAKANTVKT